MALQILQSTKMVSLSKETQNSDSPLCIILSQCYKLTISSHFGYTLYYYHLLTIKHKKRWVTCENLIRRPLFFLVKNIHDIVAGTLHAPTGMHVVQAVC